MKFFNSISRTLLLSQIHWLPRYFTLFKLSNFKRGEIVLDAACGEGIVTFGLARKNIKVIGVDRSIEKIKQANELVQSYKLNNKPYFIVCDLRNLAFRENYFDCIVSLDTLEFIREDKDVFGEFSRILKPSGKVALTFPQEYVCSASLFPIQRFLRRYIPRFLFSRDFPLSKAWLEVDSDYLRRKLGDAQRYSFGQIKERAEPFFKIASFTYFLNFFSSLATDITYGLKGFSKPKFIFFFLAVRLDYYFRKSDKGYGLFMELRKK